MMKRGYHGHHRMSPAHLQRYVSEFSGRHNQRSQDTEIQMRMMHQWADRPAAPLQGLGGRAQAQGLTPRHRYLIITLTVS